MEKALLYVTLNIAPDSPFPYKEVRNLLGESSSVSDVTYM